MAYFLVRIALSLLVIIIGSVLVAIAAVSGPPGRGLDRLVYSAAALVVLFGGAALLLRLIWDDGHSKRAS